MRSWFIRQLILERKENDTINRRMDDAVIINTILVVYIEQNTTCFIPCELQTWDYFCYYYCRCYLCLHSFQNSLIKRKKNVFVSFKIRMLYENKTIQRILYCLIIIIKYIFDQLIRMKWSILTSRRRRWHWKNLILENYWMWFNH